ncbi:hypothetical protein P4910_16620 [Pantoea stewartii]|uniref:hypothetical protein n=1 Tax=Pantoea stewartii TaxID=66269 RepID=UPI0023F7775F|nr:hypothetical protein [Pantoea stewartii]MDF7787097.1 hypothetical protein [Pantoea stewartii]
MHDFSGLLANFSALCLPGKPKAESRKPKAESRKPKAESRKPKAESRKPKAVTNKPIRSLESKPWVNT